jgi:hypothetical protein
LPPFETDPRKRISEDDGVQLEYDTDRSVVQAVCRALDSARVDEADTLLAIAASRGDNVLGWVHQILDYRTKTGILTIKPPTEGDLARLAHATDTFYAKDPRERPSHGILERSHLDAYIEEYRTMKRERN